MLRVGRFPAAFRPTCENGRRAGAAVGGPRNRGSCKTSLSFPKPLGRPSFGEISGVFGGCYFGTTGKSLVGI